MDPLDLLTIRSVELATYARNAFHAGYSDLTFEYLFELYDLLVDALEPKAQDKCESAESLKK